MLIACSNCKSQYSLSTQEIETLPFSVFKCKKCDKNIKISQCPQCKSYYSITYSSADKPQYTIKCMKCDSSFVARFPIRGINTMMESPRAPEPPVNQDTAAEPGHSSTEKTYRELFPNITKRNIERDDRIDSKAPEQKAQHRPNIAQRKNISGSAGETGFTLTEFLRISLSAFSIKRLAVSTVGVFFMILALILFNTIVGLFYHLNNPYVSIILNLFPLAIVFFTYIILATMIAKIQRAEAAGTHAQSPIPNGTFLWNAVASSAAVNIGLLLIVNAILILFGEIPIIGPILFSLLFLPVYLISAAVVVLTVLGFWFFPSIVADTDGGIRESVTGFINFIKTRNFSLIYSVLLLTISTSTLFAILYALHYGSLSLTFTISRGILSEEGMKVFSAIPLPFLQISDMSIIGSNINLFQTLIRGLMASHYIAGIILGAVVAVLTILVMSITVSITATVSHRLYMMLTEGSDPDDKSKIRTLLALTLMMVLFLLLKKVFF